MGLVRNYEEPRLSGRRRFLENGKHDKQWQGFPGRTRTKFFFEKSKNIFDSIIIWEIAAHKG